MLNEGFNTAARAAEQTPGDDVLWFNDLPTDDPAPTSDPQSGDVTEGSVDYFDFDWGAQVPHDESEMEPVLFNCDQICSDGCSGGGNGCNGNGNGCNGSGCIDNAPDQQDTGEYDILDE